MPQPRQGVRTPHSPSACQHNFPIASTNPLSEGPLEAPALAYFVKVIRSGVGSVPQLTLIEIFDDGDELDVPGHPTVIHVPGHTA